MYQKSSGTRSWLWFPLSQEEQEWEELHLLLLEGSVVRAGMFPGKFSKSQEILRNLRQILKVVDEYCV